MIRYLCKVFLVEESREVDSIHMGLDLLFVSDANFGTLSLSVELGVVSQKLDKCVELAIPVGNGPVFGHFEVDVEYFDKTQTEFPLSQWLLSADCQSVAVLEANHSEEAVFKDSGLMDFVVLPVSEVSIDVISGIGNIEAVQFVKVVLSYIYIL